MKIKKSIPSIVLLSTLVSSISINAADIGIGTGNLEFKTTVAPACGVTIDNNDLTGGINFGGNHDTNGDIKFVVYTNSISENADISFNNIVPSNNIDGKNGYFKIDQDVHPNWPADFITTVKNGDEKSISAHVPPDENLIQAGEAKVTTTLTISCS